MSKESKQRLIPWLKNRVSSGDIKGLSWIDDEQTMFRIPWKHGGKQNFDTEEDSRIFREWAIHTGKFREASDKPDPTKWKQNLRCAFNKSKDIEEVKEKRSLEGTDPYKVYRIQNNGSKRLLDVKRRRSSSPTDDEDYYEDTVSMTTVHAGTLVFEASDLGPGEETLPDFAGLMPSTGSGVRSMETAQSNSFSDPAELERKVRSGDLFKDGGAAVISLESVPSASEIQLVTPGTAPAVEVVQVVELDITDKLFDLEALQQDTNGSQENEISLADQCVLPPLDKPMTPMSCPQSYYPDVPRLLPSPTATKPAAALMFNPYPHMLIRVRYLGDVMLNQTFSHPAGCRLRASRAPRLQPLQEDEDLFGSKAARPIDLPPFSLPPGRKFGTNNSDAPKLKENGSKIFEAMYRGVELFTVQGDIFIKRFCKSGVKYEYDGNLIKVDKFKDCAQQNFGQKIFDLKNQYLPELEKFQQGKRSRPSPFVHLVFGQNKTSNEAIISISVASKLAYDQLLDIDPSAKDDDSLETESSILLSKTDEFDQRADVVRNVEEWSDKQLRAVQTGDFEPPEPLEGGMELAGDRYGDQTVPHVHDTEEAMEM